MGGISQGLGDDIFPRDPSPPKKVNIFSNCAHKYRAFFKVLFPIIYCVFKPKKPIFAQIAPIIWGTILTFVPDNQVCFWNNYILNSWKTLHCRRNLEWSLPKKSILLQISHPIQGTSLTFWLFRQIICVCKIIGQKSEKINRFFRCSLRGKSLGGGFSQKVNFFSNCL